jgi:hypothetical protein
MTYENLTEAEISHELPFPILHSLCPGCGAELDPLAITADNHCRVCGVNLAEPEVF